MSDNVPERPTVIKADRLTNSTIRNNVVVGDMDLLHAKSVDGLEASGNVQINPPAVAKPSSFWHHPITKTVLYVIGVVVAAALIYFLGLK